MPSPLQINIKQLSRLIGTPACPVIVDVRTDEDFALDPRRIPSAIRCPFLNVITLLEHINGKNVVVYCQKGLKLSEGAAALLRLEGIKAEVLSGGYLAWLDAKELVIPEKKIPERNSLSQTVWVTRARPKVDRVACAWLIKRFIDTTAQFMFVSASSVEAVAEKFNATPFDIENVFWSHREELCTFDTMVIEFQLHSEALDKMAQIIRAADTNQLPSVPEAAGLLAVSLGLSRMHSNDLEQVDAGMLIFDALYRWCRDASDETHDWPSPTKNNG